MKFWKIFRYELRYQFSHATTWLFLLVLLVFPFVITKISTPTDGIHQNAPASIVFFTIFSNFFWLLTAGAIAGDAAARDVQTRMHPLLYAAPVGKATYLGGRFLAALALNALLLLLVPLSLMLGFYSPGGRAVLLGPFRPEAYLTAYAFLALPTALVGTAIQFSMAVLSGRAIASYIGSVGLFFVSHFFVMVVAHQVGWWDLVKLLDFIGFGGLIGGEMETWTPAEQNTRLLALEGYFLWNRLIWLGVAVGWLAFTYHRFQLAHPTASSWWSRRLARRQPAPAQLPAGPVLVGRTPVRVPPVARRFGLGTQARQTLTVAWASFGQVARSPGGLALVALIAAGSAVFASEFMQHSNIPLLPTTQQVIDYLTNPLGNVKTPWLIVPLLLIYYAGELVWREREAGLSEIVDAAPVPEWVLFLGKLLGLGFVLLAWMGLLLLGGILMQVGLGYTRFELGLYLKSLFGLQLLDYLLFAVLALAVHALANQKYVGHLVLLLTLGFMGFASRLGIHHNLLVFGAAPDWSYTDLRGFGASLGPWLWFKGYWVAWAMVLAVVASLCWARGREQGLARRTALARRRFTRPTAAVAGVALGLVFGLGGWVFYNTNVLSAYRTPASRTEQLVEFERRYGRYENAPQPQLTGTKLRVELYPDQGAADIRGTYRLLNRSGVAIDSVHLVTVRGVETSAVTFDRPATVVLADEPHGYRIYALQEPLQPGDSLHLSFRVRYAPAGFRNHGADAKVTAKATYLQNLDVMPNVGYQFNRELGGAALRKKYGLAPRAEIPSLYDAKARQKSFRGDRMAFEAVVGTAPDQTAVAPGALRRTWTAAGRRYFHYQTDAPIQNQYAFFSAKYALRTEQWKNPTAGAEQRVAIRLLHHPGHAANVNRLLRSIRASLDYYTTQFGTYPYGHLTVVERADMGGELNAEASIIDYGEQFALMNPDDGPRGFDLPFYVMAHELAHQFGAGYASVEGAPVLAEGLAVYSGMQVLEKSYGATHLRRYLSFLREAYEVPRSRAAAPLLRANNAFLGYRKSPVALHALSRYIGQQNVNGAIRRLFAQHRSDTSSLPTTLDLYRELKAATPDSLHYLLRDLFETNTYWQLKTEQATAVPTAGGAWRVTLHVQARKVVVDDAGAEQEVPMNDWVEIGVIAPREKNEDVGQPLYLQKQRIRSGRQQIQVTVPRKPARAGIDPYLLLIDLNLGDNVQAVAVED